MQSLIRGIMALSSLTLTGVAAPVGILALADVVEAPSHAINSERDDAGGPTVSDEAIESVAQMLALAAAAEAADEAASDRDSDGARLGKASVAQLRHELDADSDAGEVGDPATAAGGNAPDGPVATAPDAPAPADEVLGVTVAPSVPDHVSRGSEQLARLPVHPSQVGFTISFEPASAGFGGLTWPVRRHIEIFVSPDWSDAHLRHVIAHEIGHAFDMARNSADERADWRRARGISPSLPWWADPYTSDFATPSGDFAECFAVWAAGSTTTFSRFGSCAGTGPLVAQLALH